MMHANLGNSAKMQELATMNTNPPSVSTTLTHFASEHGIPLYSKEEGGLVEGARKQFEQTYGDAEFLKRLGDKLAAEREQRLGRGKRVKTLPVKLRDYHL